MTLGDNTAMSRTVINFWTEGGTIRTSTDDLYNTGEAKLTDDFTSGLKCPLGSKTTFGLTRSCKETRVGLSNGSLITVGWRHLIHNNSYTVRDEWRMSTGRYYRKPGSVYQWLHYVHKAATRNSDFHIRSNFIVSRSSKWIKVRDGRWLFE